MRVLLVIATALWPCAALALLPISFGIALTNLDSDDSHLLRNPFLYVLVGVVGADLLAICVSWVLHAIRRGRSAAVLTAVLAIGLSTLVLLVAAASFAAA